MDFSPQDLGYIREDSDEGWRSVRGAAGFVERDVSDDKRITLLQECFAAYVGNPIAKRYIDLHLAFIIGSGMTISSDHEGTQKILSKHWDDFDNDWETKQFKRLTDFLLFGELIIPVFVGAYGHVKLGYIDPTYISEIKVDEHNPEIVREIEVYTTTPEKRKSLRVININENINSASYGLLDGDVFFFTLGGMTSSRRGFPLLLPLIEWLDSFDDFMFTRAERARLANNILWNVQYEGADEKKLREIADRIRPPQANSIRFTNEKAKWSLITPDLKASDAMNDANMFLSQAVGGLSPLFFGRGESINQATAKVLNQPSYKILHMLQCSWSQIVRKIMTFQIHQSYKHNVIDINNAPFQLNLPDVSLRDYGHLANSMLQVASAIEKMKDLGVMDDGEAKKVLNNFLKDAGLKKE